LPKIEFIVGIPLWSSSPWNFSSYSLLFTKSMKIIYSNVLTSKPNKNLYKNLNILSTFIYESKHYTILHTFINWFYFIHFQFKLQYFYCQLHIYYKIKFQIQLLQFNSLHIILYFTLPQNLCTTYMYGIHGLRPAGTPKIKFAIKIIEGLGGTSVSRILFRCQDLLQLRINQPKLKRRKNGLYC